MAEKQAAMHVQPAGFTFHFQNRYADLAVILAKVRKRSNQDHVAG
jgi:hypothetical protein